MRHGQLRSGRLSSAITYAPGIRYPSPKTGVARERTEASHVDSKIDAKNTKWHIEIMKDEW